jgi:DNA repair exonuclease SbcCD ATPase subunit
MIESLFIKNFQTHEKMRVDFDRVTTIVGPSDVGKSSIIRSLVWALTNAPSGTAFIRTGESSCAVKVLVDGHTVIRSRGKSNNEYKMDGAEFKAFGSNVPDSIADVINVLDVNLQGQFDSPFWLSLSAGEVSRRLNEVVDLSLIDKCLSLSKSRHADQKKRRDIYHEAAEKSEAAVEDLLWIDDASVEFADLERLQHDSEALELDYDDLGKMLVELEHREERLFKSAEKMEDICVLGRLAAKANKVQDDADTLQAAISAHGSLKLGVEAPEFFAFDSIGFDTLEAEIRVLERMIEKAERSARIIGRAQDDLTTMKTELVEVTGGKCPICGGEFDGEHRQTDHTTQ